MMPCESIWKIAPWMPCSLNEKMPIVTKPMWATDEYAISFFMSS
jgi:hypothetical protein